MLQRERTALYITFSASDDVNSDEKLRPNPILIRMYELRSASSFENADYFSLQTNEVAVLGGDMLAREEFILRPGEKKQLRRKSHPDVQTLGWTAGYKDLAQSEWRTVVHVTLAPESAWYRAPLPANKLKLEVNVLRRAIQVIHVD